MCKNEGSLWLERGGTYRDDGILDLLRFTRLRRIPLRFDVLQFLLIALDPPLQLRDIVFCILVPPIEHLTHADKAIAHRLQVFDETLIPRARLVLQ